MIELQDITSQFFPSMISHFACLVLPSGARTPIALHVLHKALMRTTQLHLTFSMGKASRFFWSNHLDKKIPSETENNHTTITINS